MPQPTPTTSAPTEGSTETHATPEEAAVEAADTTDEVVAEDLLVEEVSIDGMCGVY